MTNFLFIRHGAHDYLGSAIAGSKPGVHLNELGRAQAGELPDKLSLLPIDAIYSGPLERVRETAEPLAAGWRQARAWDHAMARRRAFAPEK